MRNLEQEPALTRTIQAHKPCVTDAQGCTDFDRVQFQSLRAQVQDLTNIIEAHHHAHEKHEAMKTLIRGLSPEVQPELTPLIAHAEQRITETDSFLPQPLQQHQPEVK